MDILEHSPGAVSSTSCVLVSLGHSPDTPYAPRASVAPDAMGVSGWCPECILSQEVLDRGGGLCYTISMDTTHYDITWDACMERYEAVRNAARVAMAAREDALFELRRISFCADWMAAKSHDGILDLSEEEATSREAMAAIETALGDARRSRRIVSTIRSLPGCSEFRVDLERVEAAVVDLERIEREAFEMHEGNMDSDLGS